jgi:hypothetical protein
MCKVTHALGVLALLACAAAPEAGALCSEAGEPQVHEVRYAVQTLIIPGSNLRGQVTP